MLCRDLRSLVYGVEIPTASMAGRIRWIGWCIRDDGISDAVLDRHDTRTRISASMGHCNLAGQKVGRAIRQLGVDGVSDVVRRIAPLVA